MGTRLAGVLVLGTEAVNCTAGRKFGCVRVRDGKYVFVFKHTSIDTKFLRIHTHTRTLVLRAYVMLKAEFDSRHRSCDDASVLVGAGG